MESFVDFLIQAGPTGMFIAAFLAGSIFPFSSEVVMIALLGAGASPLGLLLWGTVGNILGSVVNYSIGTLGKEEWITRYAKVSPDKLRRGKRLENWELDYYRTHRAVVELRGVESAEEQAEKRRLLELLGG